MVTLDVGKAFESLDHTFLISILKKFEFGQNFVFKNRVSLMAEQQQNGCLYSTLWLRYSAYADGTTLFQKDVNSIKEMVNSFHIFSRFSALKLNISKCEISGIGVLKGVKVDLVLDTIKILGTHFSYNEK